MTTPEVVLLSYGNQPSTTAAHLEHALEGRTRVIVQGRGHPRRRPPQLPPAAPMIWVESGRFSLPGADQLLNRPSAAWLIDTHRGLGWRAEFGDAFDHVFVAQRAALDPLHRRGIASASWLPLAAPAQLVSPTPPWGERAFDVAFVGNLYEGTPRARVLDALADSFSLAPIRRYVAPPRMMDIYRQARVVVNMPISRDLNMRAFEAAAAGALLVTGPMDGLDVVFPRDGWVEVDGIHSSTWVETVGTALADPRSADRATAAYRVITSDHTYDNRAATILATLADLPHDEGRDRERMLGFAAASIHYRRPHSLLVPHLGLTDRVRVARRLATRVAAGINRRLFSASDGRV